MLNSYAKRDLLTGWQFTGLFIFVTMSYLADNSIAQRILYEDNHLLVVSKLSGEIVQGDKTGDMPLSEILKNFIKERDHKPGNVFMGVPHRLDRPVSGICIFAKTSKSLERLNRMFRDGEVQKTYLALVSKKPPADSALLTHYIIRNEKQNKSYARETPAEGAREARLRYRYLESTHKYHLLEIDLLTGRHHQIRCQLAAIGCPIKGDLKYGARRSNPDGSISLHAYRVTLDHPVRKEQLVITAPWDPFGTRLKENQ
ncbi:MAG: RNA pseudouridine synthase [Eubacteriales bacterium]|nr:RNA pseudouridine synthase [Eubacteriales bacterium]